MMTCKLTDILSEVAETLVQPLHHGQEALGKDEVVAGIVQDSLSLLQECEVA